MPVKKKENISTQTVVKGSLCLPEDEFAVRPLSPPSDGPMPAFEPRHKVAKEVHVCQIGNEDLARGIENQSHGRIDEFVSVAIRVFVVARKGLGQVHKKVID